MVYCTRLENERAQKVPWVRILLLPPRNMLMNNKNLKVINLWGGPGIGKSTTASGLFNIMKLRKKSVELVTEYAKQLVWEKQDASIFENQILLLAKQEQKQKILVGQVEYCITDSPVLLSYLYAPKEYYSSFFSLVNEVHMSYDNIDILLNRVKDYDANGRVHTLEQSIEKDKQIKNLLDSFNIKYYNVDADENAHENIYSLLF